MNRISITKFTEMCLTIRKSFAGRYVYLCGDEKVLDSCDTIISDEHTCQVSIWLHGKIKMSFGIPCLWTWNSIGWELSWAKYTTYLMYLPRYLLPIIMGPPNPTSPLESICDILRFKTSWILNFLVKLISKPADLMWKRSGFIACTCFLQLDGWQGFF